MRSQDVACTRTCYGELEFTSGWIDDAIEHGREIIAREIRPSEFVEVPEYIFWTPRVLHLHLQCGLNRCLGHRRRTVATWHSADTDTDAFIVEQPPVVEVEIDTCTRTDRCGDIPVVKHGRHEEITVFLPLNYLFPNLLCFPTLARLVNENRSLEFSRDSTCCDFNQVCLFCREITNSIAEQPQGSEQRRSVGNWDAHG